MGFEPTTSTLARLHSGQLSYYCVERVMGIGPTYSVWKTDALPLSYTRMAPSPRFP